MNIDEISAKNKPLEEEIAKLVESQDAHQMAVILQQLSGSLILQPGIFPPELTPDKLRELAQNDPKNPALQPRPMVLRNKDEVNYLPVFTSKEQIPEDQKYPAMIMVPFMECAKLADRQKEHISGIVLNPFTQNLIIKQQAIEMMIKNVPQQGEVKMSAAQMHAFLRSQVELKVLPAKLSTEKNDFIDDLMARKGKVLIELLNSEYAKVKGLEDKNPYTEKDFDFLCMNMSDTERVVQITMPTRGTEPYHIISAFLFYNPQTEESVYYTIRRRPENLNQKKLGFVDAQGNYQDIGEAPTEGSELYTLLDMLPWKHA